MSKLTNPTNEQELRENLYGISFLARADSETGERTYSFMESELLEVITAHTNAEIAKALIKELENVDKLTRPTLPDSGSVEMNVRAWCMDRIAILAKLKEVK